VGNGVYIGTGATLVGKIKIGDGAKIAANTLVMTNVPAGATVMGVPGRIVMRARVATAPSEEITKDGIKCPKQGDVACRLTRSRQETRTPA
jgi:serine acetyltransferase